MPSRTNLPTISVRRSSPVKAPLPTQAPVDRRNRDCSR
jgi:hypothetical protein